MPTTTALSLVLALSAAGAALGGPPVIEKVAFEGWTNNLKLSNGDVELVVTLDVGPRVIAYNLPGKPNVMKVYPDQAGKSGEPEWTIRGGHRLWVGPEDLTRTYALDNGPVTYEVSPGSVTFRPAPDATYGIQKELRLALDASGTGVTVHHRLTNTGAQPATLAPWGLTVLAPGGVEFLPMPARRPHPGPPANAKSPADYAADRLLVLWPYFDFTDPRWTFGSRLITLRQDASRGPTKIGLAQSDGWAAYLNQGTLFVKKFGYQPGAAYPDGGCNFETFTNEDMLEMESLGPLVTLAPGQSVEHQERWALHPVELKGQDEAAVRAAIVPLIEGSAGR
jgi:hypothetical protein